MFCTGCGNVLCNQPKTNVVLLIVSIHAPKLSTLGCFGHVLVRLSSIASIRSFVFTRTKHFNKVLKTLVTTYTCSSSFVLNI